MIEFIIEMEIPSQNSTDRTHWSKRRLWGKTADLWIRSKVKPSPLAIIGKRHVSILAYRRRRITDHANLVGGCKCLVDALVRARLLADDSDKWATFTYEQALASTSPTGQPCTRIRITELTPAP